MPRRKANPPPLSMGRPVKHIDWEMVDDLLIAGCLGTEIAPFFDMHPETFYDRVRIEKGIAFTDYAAQKKSNGHAILRQAQFKKAIGATDKGDNTLLIWLGKSVLQQRETSGIEVSQDTIKAFESLMSQQEEMRNERKKAEEFTNNHEETYE